ELVALPIVRARFEQEAKVAAQLQSPYIVRVLDYGMWGEVPYMAMEYLEGEDLDVRLRRCGRLDIDTTLAIVKQVARALAKAHAVGLVHRDLKPDNIFLVPDEDREIAKVLDFGVAKALAGSNAIRTQNGMLIGTLEYMSPEQLRGVPNIDHRCDLWSLAVVTFLCLHGRLPFEAETLGDPVTRMFRSPLPRPSDIAPDLPRAFDAWWERAASRDPANRFPTAKDMVNALAIALEFPDEMVSIDSERSPF